MPQNVTLVPIPTALFQRIETALDRLGHDSVDAFVVHAVRTALAPHEAAPVAPAEEAQIVERLRRLGYID